MKRALRYLLSFALPIFFLFVANSHANAQCPVVIDSIVTADVTCSGANDGSIAIYVSGGFADYTYQTFNPPAAPQFFTTSATNHSFIGLGSGSGNYQIIVVGEDGAGGNCDPVFDIATVNDPPAFTILVTTTNDSCPDGNVGTAVVNVTGGVAPYTYSWLPFIETSDSISGLDGGNYSVTVTDTNGCPTTANYTIVSPPDWDGTLTGSNPTCFGGTDGSVTSTGITGGTPPYTFSWTGTAQTTENIVGLGDGTYTLTVTDDEGCTQVFSTVILTEPTQLVITETHVNVSCDGLGDGSIDVSVSGGVSPYSYLWTNGATTQGITGLSSGNYILTVTDSVGCSDNISVTILDGSSLSLSSISISSECNEANGSIDLTVTGGSSNYGYSWQPDGQTTEDLSGLAAGIYDVTVTDNTIGCIDSLTVIVNDFPGHDVTGLITDGSNCISNDGSIDASVTGGSGDFSYSWSHGPVTEDVSGLAAGTYFLTVTDNVQGCVSIASFNVLTGNEVIVATNVTLPTCGLINGAIDLTISGGTNPYTFLWSSGAISEDISGVGPGVYSVNITDVNGCPFDTTFTLSNQGSPVVTETVVEPNCSGSNDGSISLSVAGGTGPYTFNWSTGETTASITNLDAGTYNIIVTDQATGCISNESYTLTSPPGVNGFVDIANVSCGGANDGAIDLTLSGGTPPYSYLWTPGNFTTQEISNLSAGTYTVVFTDDSGCTLSSAFTVTGPPTLVITETHLDVSCNGDDDGSIDISVSGGTPGFTYLWQPGGSTVQDTSGLSPGNYEVFVTDAGGCSDSLEIEITEPPVLTLTSISTDATCNTSCDGTATVAPSGGTPVYTYVWTPNVSTGPSATALCAGTYDVVVTDVNGCQETASFIISDVVVDLALTTTNISCNGSCDGTGSTVVTGTNPPFTYDWQPSGGNGPTASNLCAGTYTLTVTDTTGCSVTEPFTIIDQDPIVITMAVTDVSCEGLSDGDIDLTVTGGVGPYTYQWFPLGQTTEDINGLPAGDYSIVVTDANGCTSSTVSLGGSFGGSPLALPDGTGAIYNTTINVTGFPSGGTLTNITDFDGICINIEHSWLSDLDIELTCPNGQTVMLEGSFPTGQAGANVFFGDAVDNDESLPTPGVGFVYCWDNSPTFGTMEAEAGFGNTVTVTEGEALPAGSYTSIDPLSNLIGCPLNGDWTVTVTDNFAQDNGFIFDWSIELNGSGSNDSIATVNEPGPITSTSTVTDAECGSCDGEITAVPAGGNGPYTFLWNTGATTATISNLCAGVYNVIVTDANGCEGNFFIPVNHSDGPTGANTTIVDASCFGTCDGEATVTGIGGAAPYTYQWVPGGFATSNVTGLCAGTYNVQIQDSLNCIYTETIVVDEPAEIFIGQTVVNSLCGQCTGEVELSPISGQAPFIYDWSPAVPNMDTLATGLCAGVYNVTVTDATGCEVVVTSLVNDDPSPALTMTGTDPLCNAICDGEAVVTPIGGAPPFTYLWDDAAAQTDSVATILCAGLYTATITDDNGCVAVNQITLNEPDPIGLSLLIIDNGTCAGNCDGSITVIPSGGTIPFTYLWDDPLAQTTATASNLCAGVYNVVVTDANGCTDNNSGSVSNPVGLTASTTGTDASCNGVCDGSAFATISGGTPPFTYLWDDPAGQTSDTAVALCAGSYSVTITDVNGCDFIAPVTIDEPDPIIITFSNVIGLLCDGDCIGEATADVTGGTAPYTYSWDDALTQSTTTADSLCASTYTVTVTDANGCTETATVAISGPNGFSSNITSQTSASCNGNCDGGAVVEGVGGTPPYTFQWNDISNTANDTVSGLCAGIYSVTVTDDNGCISVSTVVIDQPDPLTATTTGDDVSCFGECDGEATTFTLGGTFPYFYQWNDPANQTTLTAVGLCTGSYQVLITDANGCVADTSADIFEPTEIVIDTTIVEATCGICNGEITVTPNGGVQPYTYLWGNGETTAAISSLCPGVYTVDVTDVIGCTVNFDIAVSNDGGPTSATVAVTDASCFGVCDGEAT
ncbi:MAG: subtilisin-like proprotein convertase family protein, partial [Bacteroidia bacterium]